VHLRENVMPIAKKGMPGKMEFVPLRKKVLDQEEIQEISREIIEDTKLRKDGFIEIMDSNTQEILKTIESMYDEKAPAIRKKLERAKIKPAESVLATEPEPTPTLTTWQRLKQKLFRNKDQKDAQ